MPAPPIFVATHPRACSTAFERVFMTRRDMTCAHEPFGDAYYFGPEMLAGRYMQDEKARVESGFRDVTYKDVLDRIDKQNNAGKRLFLKDMAQYLIPPNGKPASIAPSLKDPKRGIGTAKSDGLKKSAAPSHEATKIRVNGLVTDKTQTSPPYPYVTTAEPGNPTVMPESMLKQFHFAFLIRHPRNSIPSYYRCTVPPLDAKTGFYNFLPEEAGYTELRRLFDYLRESKQIGPTIAGQHPVGTNGIKSSNTEICVIDADDVLDHPAEVIEAFCKSVGIKYTPEMLRWDSEEDQRVAKEAFAKWAGFHDDALDSKGLEARVHKKVKSDEERYHDWVARYGAEGAKVIKDTVEKNVADYEYLKKFAVKVHVPPQPRT